MCVQWYGSVVSSANSGARQFQDTATTGQSDAAVNVSQTLRITWRHGYATATATLTSTNDVARSAATSAATSAIHNTRAHTRDAASATGWKHQQCYQYPAHNLITRQWTLWRLGLPALPPNNCATSDSSLSCPTNLWGYGTDIHEGPLPCSFPHVTLAYIDRPGL